MPKEFWFDSTVSQLADEKLDSLIAQLRERVLAIKE
jgi:hypothetical protein